MSTPTQDTTPKSRPKESKPKESPKKEAKPKDGGQSVPKAQAKEAKLKEQPKAVAAGNQQPRAPRSEPRENKKEVSLFGHLTQPSNSMKNVNSNIHPSIIQLGNQFQDRTIVGSNARCIALLNAFKQVVKDYQTPAGQLLHRDMHIYLRPMIQFVVDCRPISVSMGNAINYFKSKISETLNLSEEEAKSKLLDDLDTFIEDRIIQADKMIVQQGLKHIKDGDVVLTHAASHTVEEILCQAQRNGVKFSVVLVDSRPNNEAKQLLKRLVDNGVRCTYTVISSVSHVINQATKVLVGAHCMFSNGALLSRCGTAMIALLAHRAHLPVIVCCETYKFTERVLLEAISHNELGDPDMLKTSNVLDNWKKQANLKLLNLTYDLTPAQFIGMIISEVGIFPPTSVSVVVREYHQQPWNDHEESHSDVHLEF